MKRSDVRSVGTSRRGLFGAAAAIGASFVVGGTNRRLTTPLEAGAQEAPSPVAPGEISRAEMPAWTFSVLTLQDPYPGVMLQPTEPPAGTRYVAIEVIIDNASDQALNFSPGDVRLRDAVDIDYRGGTAVGSEPYIAPRNLNSGERSRGWVWFTVPVDARVLEIVYSAPSPQLRISLDESG